MKNSTFLILFYFTFLYPIYSQTLTWNTATRTGSAPNYTYTGTGISAVISSNAVTLGDGTPRVDGTSGISACYLSPSLALYAGFFNSYVAATNSHITTTFTFAPTYGCSVVSFKIKDINSGESFTDWLDVVELSATYDNAGLALPAANITTSLPSNVTRSVSGTTVKLVGHSSSSETIGSYTSGTACGDATITFTPPAGLPLKTFTIKYRPGYGTSSANAYYTSGTHPAAQYISLGNLSFTATAGCTGILPIELMSFNGGCTGNKKTFIWETASETNNNFFTLEHSNNAIDFTETGIVNGSGTTTSPHSYSTSLLEENKELQYYRLKQTDYDGHFTYSEIIHVECEGDKPVYSNVKIYPNPSNNQLNINLGFSIEGNYNISIRNIIGQEVKLVNYSKGENDDINFLIDDLPNGIYFLKLIDLTNNGNIPIMKFIVEKQ